MSLVIPSGRKQFLIAPHQLSEQRVFSNNDSYSSRRLFSSADADISLQENDTGRGGSGSGSGSGGDNDDDDNDERRVNENKSAMAAICAEKNLTVEEERASEVGGGQSRGVAPESD